MGCIHLKLHFNSFISSIQNFLGFKKYYSKHNSKHNTKQDFSVFAKTLQKSDIENSFLEIICARATETEDST